MCSVTFRFPLMSGINSFASWGLIMTQDIVFLYLILTIQWTGRRYWSKGSLSDCRTVFTKSDVTRRSWGHAPGSKAVLALVFVKVQNAGWNAAENRFSTPSKNFPKLVSWAWHSRNHVRDKVLEEKHEKGENNERLATYKIRHIGVNSRDTRIQRRRTLHLLFPLIFWL